MTRNEEYNKALYEMNGSTGLGSNAIRVSVATPEERCNPQSQWHSNPNNPMVAHHHQHMQHFNQAIAGFRSQSDSYNYYYSQGGDYCAPQQFYEQQMWQRQEKEHSVKLEEALERAKVNYGENSVTIKYFNMLVNRCFEYGLYSDARNPDVEDQGEQSYPALR